MSPLRSADTSTYRVVSETALPVGTVTRSRMARVDEAVRRAEFSGSIGSRRGAGPASQTSLTIVVDGDQAYLQFADWTGPRSGKWLRVDQTVLAEAEIPVTLTAPRALPPELARFRPHGVRDLHGLPVIDGRIPAADGLSLLGLSHLVAKDPELAKSLRGHFGVAAKLNSKGCLDFVELRGENSRVTGSSTAVPAAVLEALIRASRGVIYISSVGAPQRIVVPEPGSVIDKGRI